MSYCILIVGLPPDKGTYILDIRSKDLLERPKSIRQDVTLKNQDTTNNRQDKADKRQDTTQKNRYLHGNKSATSTSLTLHTNKALDSLYQT